MYWQLDVVFKGESLLSEEQDARWSYLEAVVWDAKFCLL
jgi:hypothetical protein